MSDVDAKLKEMGWGVVSSSEQNDALAAESKAADADLGQVKFLIQCRLGDNKVILRIGKHTAEDATKLNGLAGTKVTFDDNNSAVLESSTCDDGMHVYVTFKDIVGEVPGGGPFTLVQ